MQVGFMLFLNFLKFLTYWKLTHVKNSIVNNTAKLKSRKL